MYNHNQSMKNIGIFGRLSWGVKYLLIINVAIFFLEHPLGIPFTDWFALEGNWYKELFGFGQLFTYMFIHGSFGHLFSNMLGLFFIGPTVERTLGPFRFFVLYYISGILGGLGWSLLAEPFSVEIYGQVFTRYPVCLGASGAVMGILGAFAALYPRAQLLLWFVIPIRAWVLAIILAVWELSETIGHPRIGGVANAAHLVGGVAGFCYALTIAKPHLLENMKRKWFGKTGGPSHATAPPRSRPRQQTLSKEEIDHILDKIGKEGMGALTPHEREMLKRATR